MRKAGEIDVVEERKRAVGVKREGRMIECWREGEGGRE